jgi:hypothetical protein
MGSIPGWVIALVKKKSAEQWLKLSDYMHATVLPKRAFEQAAEEEELAKPTASITTLETPLAPVEPSTRQPTPAAANRRRVVVEDDEAESSEDDNDDNVIQPVKKSRPQKQKEEYHDSWSYDVSNQETLRHVESLLIRLDANVAVLNHRITLLQSQPQQQQQQQQQASIVSDAPKRSERARLGWRILTLLFAWPVLVVILYHFFMRRRLRLRQ